MSMIHCPLCHEPVRVPDAKIPPGSYARCGWCSDAFPVAEAIAKLPPMLQILSADGELLNLTEGVSGSGYDTVVEDGARAGQIGSMEGNSITPSPVAVLDDANEGAGVGMADFGSEAEQAPFDEVDGNYPDHDGTTGEVSFEPSDENEFELAGPAEREVEVSRINDAIQSRSRTKRKQASPLAMMLKMAVGGFMAIPIAGAILYFMGVPLPVDIGFLNTESGAGLNSGSGTRAAAPLPQREPAEPRILGSLDRPELSAAMSLDSTPSIGDDPLDALPTATAESDLEVEGDPQADAFGIPSDANSIDEVSDSVPDIEPEVPDLSSAMTMPEIPAPETSALETSDPKTSDPKTPELKTPELETPELEAAESEAAETSGPSLSPQISESIDEANAELDAAIEVVEKGAIDKALFFSAYREIAEVAAMIDADSADAAAVRDLMMKVGSSPLASLYSKAGTGWIGSAQRKTDGILLIGKSGSNLEGALLTFPNEKSVNVISSDELPDGNVVAIGRIAGSADKPVIELSAVQSVE